MNDIIIYVILTSNVAFCVYQIYLLFPLLVFSLPRRLQEYWCDRA